MKKTTMVALLGLIVMTASIVLVPQRAFADIRQETLVRAEAMQEAKSYSPAKDLLETADIRQETILPDLMLQMAKWYPSEGDQAMFIGSTPEFPARDFLQGKQGETSVGQLLGFNLSAFSDYSLIAQE